MPFEHLAKWVSHGGLQVSCRYGHPNTNKETHREAARLSDLALNLPSPIRSEDFPFLVSQYDPGIYEPPIITTIRTQNRSFHTYISHLSLNRARTGDDRNADLRLCSFTLEGSQTHISMYNAEIPLLLHTHITAFLPLVSVCEVSFQCGNIYIIFLPQGKPNF